MHTSIRHTVCKPEMFYSPCVFKCILNRTVLLQIDQFLDSPGFHEFLEKGYGSSRTEENLMDKLQQAMAKGQNPSVILPAPAASMEILMISNNLSQEKGGSFRKILSLYIWYNMFTAVW